MNKPIYIHDVPPPSEMLDTVAAARFLGVSKSFLDKKRVSGGGPMFCKVGRRVLYNRSDLHQWLCEHRYGSTSEAA